MIFGVLVGREKVEPVYIFLQIANLCAGSFNPIKSSVQATMFHLEELSVVSKT